MGVANLGHDCEMVLIHCYRCNSHPGEEAVVTLGRLELAGQIDAIDLQWFKLIEAEMSNS